ncbi:short-chain dehydrogenase/reductase-like protein [Neofusicoccum parvum]|uniref:Short-chain dehydrogenase/reductase-like protein n=1 Tax=Neofusicoccum parvum TaxID=310453 RepID=A0ACB5SET8_9PEZI|nr:short-chain dehydrogenase/reductase-like protein [Neofusicoccum parvum]
MSLHGSNTTAAFGVKSVANFIASQPQHAQSRSVRSIWPSVYILCVADATLATLAARAAWSGALAAFSAGSSSDVRRK